MNFGELVRRPFEIVVRRPYLWLLGFLAGGAGAYNFSSSGSGSSTWHVGTPSSAAVQGYWNENWEWIVGLIAVFAVFAIVMFAIGCIADGGIIRAAIEHDENRPYRLGVAWRSGYPSGWRIAGIRLLTLLLIAVPLVMIITLGVAAAATATSAVGVAVLFGLAAAATGLAALAFWLVLCTAEQLGERAIVLDGAGVTDALGTGFRMIRWHFKEVAIAWLIMLGLSIAAGIAMAVFTVLAAIIIAIPTGVIGVSSWVTGATAGVVVSVTFAIVFLIGAVLAAAGWWAAYSSVYWTLLFKRVSALPVAAARRPFISPA
jgi:hypothetical protein